MHDCISRWLFWYKIQMKRTIEMKDNKTYSDKFRLFVRRFICPYVSQCFDERFSRSCLSRGSKFTVVWWSKRFCVPYEWYLIALRCCLVCNKKILWDKLHIYNVKENLISARRKTLISALDRWIWRGALNAREHAKPYQNRLLRLCFRW